MGGGALSSILLAQLPLGDDSKEMAVDELLPSSTILLGGDGEGGGSSFWSDFILLISRQTLIWNARSRLWSQEK